MLSNQTVSSEVEDVWCDELNVTISDASSVFTDDTQSSTSSSTTAAKHVFVRLYLLEWLTYVECDFR